MINGDRFIMTEINIDDEVRQYEKEATYKLV